jgi:hypothetical protein
MARKIISKEEAVELKRLYTEHVAAVNRAGVILVSKGVDSPEFMEADEAAGTIHRRLRRLLDTDADQIEANEAAAVAAPDREGQLPFPCVYVQARPKGRQEGSPIDDYVVEDDADHVLGAFKKQHEAIEWARTAGHRPLVARVRHRNDKKQPDHWRMA